MLIGASFVTDKKQLTYVSPFTVQRYANYKDFNFWWESVGDVVGVDLRYSFNNVSWQTFYSSNSGNSSYSTRFSFKALTYFKAVGITSTNEEVDSGIIELQVGH